MRLAKWLVGSVLAVLVLTATAGLAVGNYVYTSGTKVPCQINADDLDNIPARFYTSYYNSGPFRGDGWNKWVNHDLSSWWLFRTKVEDIYIEVEPGVRLASWWLPAKNFETNRTVIVTHGIGTSKRDFTTLLPAAMLVRGNFNVLLVDQRNAGQSTCVDGRHSAGQRESSDFAKVAQWLVEERGIPPESIGMFGVSGGAIATSLTAAKTENIAAFAMEGTIFDFNAAAEKEVEFQGFPKFLWNLALFSADVFHGVDLSETSVPEAIEAAGQRPMLILHGDKDSRLDYQSSVDFENYAKQVGVPIRLERFENADHAEGMLTETKRYAKLLTEFFGENLK